MAVFHLSSPVVLDGRVSDEKLNELLALQGEYPELDYKSTIDITSTPGLVEFVKDVGAMQVRGAYIVGGVDNQATPTGDMDAADPRLFDEANLRRKLLRYLPEPVELRSRVLDRDGRRLVLIFVGPNPLGCAIFRADGKYVDQRGNEKIVFRTGDIFWRNGTSSERINQQGLEEILERRIANAKTSWLSEQQEIRRAEQAEIRAAYESRNLAGAALGTVNLDLPADALNLAALELVRAGDSIALVHLMNDAVTRARDAIDRDEIETELADVLDKLTCLGAAFLAYEQRGWFERVVSTLSAIYGIPVGPDDVRRFGYSTSINAQEKAPRVWLEVIVRVFALGALAVRRRDWAAVRTLTVQLPHVIADDGYDTNWLRHALTMTSRAQHLRQQQDSRTVELSLLTLARNQIERLACLRSDGLELESEVGITSLAQFDALSNLVAIDEAADTDGRVFYPNFARFRQDRIQPVVEQLLVDSAMRQTLFRRGDDDLAIALAKIGQIAASEGVRYLGFDGWDRTLVGDFIERNLPQPSPEP